MSRKSKARAIDAFFEESFEAAKRLAQLQSIATKDEWSNFWKSFFESYEKDFPGMNGFKMKQLIKDAQFNFQTVKEFASRLPDNKERLAFFLEVKTDYQQDTNGVEWTGFGEKSFADKCDLEISKFKELLKLENSQRKPTTTRNEKSISQQENLGRVSAIERVNTIDSRKSRSTRTPRWYTQDQLQELEFTRRKKEAELEAERDFRAKQENIGQNPRIADSGTAKGKTKANKDQGELTTEQAAIFFHYFFEIAGTSPDLAASKKIDVIHSVTRWSRNSISNIIYDKKGGGIFRKANGDDYTTFEADMGVVKSLFQKLGLRDVVQKIDDDISSIDL
jgi:hypothetical protein